MCILSSSLCYLRSHFWLQARDAWARVVSPGIGGGSVRRYTAMAPKKGYTKHVYKYNKPHRCSLCGATGHRKETCPLSKKRAQTPGKRRKPLVKIAPPTRKPTALDKKVLYTTHSTAVRKTGLKGLKQIPYPEVCSFSEARAKQELGKLGLLPPLARRQCWKCGCAMARQQSQGKYAFMCPRKACRCKVGRADLAYTPLWAKQFAGVGYSYKTFLQALYVYALKIPQDSGQHLAGVGYKEMQNWSKAFRHATAFAELQTGRDTQFGDGTVEFDGTTSATAKVSKKKNRHLGRFIVVVHRESGQWALEPLLDKDVLKAAPSPPEEYDEVKAPILKKMHGGHVASSDGAQAFKKLARKDLAAMGVPHATVVHGKKEFSRVVRIPVTSLSKRLRQRVARLPTTNGRTYRFKAGDQCCEGVFGMVKRNLRRLNLAGRTTGASINFLAGAWLARGAGLEEVARGVALYQHAVLDSMNPKLAFKDTSWLRALEPT